MSLQEDMKLVLSVISPFLENHGTDMEPFTFQHTRVRGYFLSKNVTMTGKPGEFLHLFW